MSEENEEMTQENGQENGQETPKIEIPEGFDVDLYDTESKSLKIDAVREKLTKLEADLESEKKQKLDMRRKLSRGEDLPKGVEEYAKGYKFSEEVEAIEKNDVLKEHIDTVFADIDDFAASRGLRLDDTNAFKDLAIQYMTNLGIIQTPEAKEAKLIEVRDKTQEILGDDTDNILKDNDKFYANYGLFQDSKNWIMQQSIENPQANKFFYQVRALLKGNTADIPTANVVNGTLPSDAELAREYKTASDDRRIEIIKARIANGRSGSFL